MRPLVGSVTVNLEAVAYPGLAGAQNPTPNLLQATLKEMMGLRVTSSARTSQRAGDVLAKAFLADLRPAGEVSRASWQTGGLQWLSVPACLPWHVEAEFFTSWVPRSARCELQWER